MKPAHRTCAGALLTLALPLAALAGCESTSQPAVPCSPAPPAASSSPSPAARAPSPPVPAGFQPASASFLSSTSGFVLGTVGCGLGQSCRVWLVATTDGGAHWQFLNAPPVRLSARGSGVKSVVFASRRDGWLYGPALWATHDGGAHWRRLFTSRVTRSVTASAGISYAVAKPLVAGPKGFELFSSPSSRNAWTRVGQMTAELATVAVSGRSAWFGPGEDAVIGSTHLWATVDGVHWHQYAFRCPGGYYGLAGIAAASPAHVFFLCLNYYVDTGHEGMEVLSSADGGKTMHLAARQAMIIGDGGLIAVPPGQPKVIIFAASAGAPSYLARSADGGKTWKQVEFYPSGGSWNSLSYVSRTVGWAVRGQPGLSHLTQLLRTSDAGVTWYKAGF